MWATSEFQLGEGGLACHAIAWRRRKIFDYFGDDDVGGLALTARRLRADSGCQQYGGRHRDFEYV